MFGIFTEVILGCGPEAVEAGSQIARVGRQEDLEMRMKAEHQAWRSLII